MIFRLIISCIAFAISMISLWFTCKLHKKNREMLRELEIYKSLYEEAKENYFGLKRKVEEYPEPKGCKHGGWCKGCSHGITVHSYPSVGYSLPTTFTVCGLSRCDKFENKELWRP